MSDGLNSQRIHSPLSTDRIQRLNSAYGKPMILIDKSKRPTSAPSISPTKTRPKGSSPSRPTSAIVHTNDNSNNNNTARPLSANPTKNNIISSTVRRVGESNIEMIKTHFNTSPYFTPPLQHIIDLHFPDPQNTTQRTDRPSTSRSRKYSKTPETPSTPKTPNTPSTPKTPKSPKREKTERLKEKTTPSSSTTSAEKLLFGFARLEDAEKRIEILHRKGEKQQAIDLAIEILALTHLLFGGGSPFYDPEDSIKDPSSTFDPYFLAKARWQLANSYLRAGLITQAQSHCNIANDIWSKIPPPQHAIPVVPLLNLPKEEGQSTKQDEKSGKSIAHLHRTILITQGVCFTLQGKHSLAHSVLDKALIAAGIGNKKLNKSYINPLDVIPILKAKAKVYIDEGKLEKAKMELMRALDVLKKDKKDVLFDVPIESGLLVLAAEVHKEFGCIHQMLNEDNDAITKFKQSLDFFTKWDNSCFERGEVALCLSTTLVKLRNFEKAEEYLLIAEQVYSNTLGPFNERTLDVERQRGLVLIQCHRYLEAKEQLRKVAVHESKLYGALSPQLVETTRALGTIHVAMKEYKLALALFELVLERYEIDASDPKNPPNKGKNNNKNKNKNKNNSKSNNNKNNRKDNKNSDSEDEEDNFVYLDEENSESEEIEKKSKKKTPTVVLDENSVRLEKMRDMIKKVRSMAEDSQINPETNASNNDTNNILNEIESLNEMNSDHSDESENENGNENENRSDLRLSYEQDFENENENEDSEGEDDDGDDDFDLGDSLDLE